LFTTILFIILIGEQKGSNNEKNDDTTIADYQHRRYNANFLKWV